MVTAMVTVTEMAAGYKKYHLLVSNRILEYVWSLHLTAFIYSCFLSLRFTQLNDNWIYDKSENLSMDELSSKVFTHLLVEADGSETSSRLDATHTVLDEINAFNGIKITPNQFPGLTIDKKPAITIFKRK